MITTALILLGMLALLVWLIATLGWFGGVALRDEEEDAEAPRGTPPAGDEP